jgi:hypothetical protein
LHASVLKDWPKRRGDLGREVEGNEMRAQRGDSIGQDLEPCFCA